MVDKVDKADELQPLHLSGKTSATFCNHKVDKVVVEGNPLLIDLLPQAICRHNELLCVRNGMKH